MMPETENARTIPAVRRLAANVTWAQKAFAQTLAGLGDCPDCCRCAPGIGHLVPGQGANCAEQGDGSIGSHSRLGGFAKTNHSRQTKSFFPEMCSLLSLRLSMHARMVT